MTSAFWSMYAAALHSQESSRPSNASALYGQMPSQRCDYCGVWPDCRLQDARMVLSCCVVSESRRTVDFSRLG